MKAWDFEVVFHCGNFHGNFLRFDEQLFLRTTLSYNINRERLSVKGNTFVSGNIVQNDSNFWIISMIYHEIFSRMITEASFPSLGILFEPQTVFFQYNM